MLNLLTAFILFGFVFTASGCDFVYRLLQKEGAEEKEVLGDVISFESNEGVAEIQALLKLYGYRIGKVDGKFGPNTRAAIETFQKDQGLKLTRFLDKPTWEKLTVFVQNGMVVDGKPDTKTVQTALLAAGFDPGKPDGKAGPRTQQALKDFQRAHGLKPDGLTGYKTFQELSRYLSSP